jgi:AcrR family transcriptional regulator
LIETPLARLEPRERQRRIQPLFDQLPARGRRDVLDRDAVASNQRSRMIGAMIAEVAKRGYADTTLARLVALAGVSKRAFHEQFGTKEAYFLATYDAIVASTLNQLRLAYASERGWEGRLRQAFRTYTTEVAEEPNAARLVLLEALSAGPAAAARMRRTRQLFERAVGASFADTPGGVALPPLIVKGIVCGVERATRQRLIAGEASELPALADQLSTWTLSYRSVAAPELCALSAMHPRALAPCCRRPGVENDWARLLRCAARIAAAGGYAQLTPSRIAGEAGVSEARFDELFESTEECFVDAMDRLGLEALVCSARAFRNGDYGVTGIHRAIAALMRHVATNPLLVQVAFVEIFALGPAGIARRERLLGQFADQLARVLPALSAQSRLAADATVGAVWGIISHYVARGAVRLLPSLIDPITYITLAPVMGGDGAAEAILTMRAV